jgi:hypothetical protein
MKLYSLDSYNKPLLTLEVDEEDNLYTCDMSIHNPKFIVGGKKGNLFYFIRKS